ncbi:hypothetical protein DL93DRAFT_2099709 [Clavulina sp. PMI_390]|nr:hypothetical protein DL93DRAFT_2099709 [Clavulina sp. PMI_390]
MPPPPRLVFVSCNGDDLAHRRDVPEREVFGAEACGWSSPVSSSEDEVKEPANLHDTICGETEDLKTLEQFGPTKTGHTDLQTIFAALPKVGLRNGLIVYGGVNGIMIALLHLLPKLKGLEIRTCHSVQYLTHSCFATFVGGIPAGLKSISNLFLLEKVMSSGFLTNEIVPFTTLPCIKKLTVFSLHGENDQYSAGAAPVSRVGVGRSHNPTPVDDAASLPFTQIGCSRRFEYEFGELDEAYEHYTLTSLLPGLLGQASSLKELIIDSGPWDPLVSEPFMGSLAGMTALETLRLSSRFFFRVDEAADNDSDVESSIYPRDVMRWITRLPPNLVILELNIEGVDPDTFLEQTGLPKSLRIAR